MFIVVVVSWYFSFKSTSLQLNNIMSIRIKNKQKKKIKMEQNLTSDHHQ